MISTESPLSTSVNILKSIFDIVKYHLVLVQSAGAVEYTDCLSAEW